jgi:hypothetical protein
VLASGENVAVEASANKIKYIFIACNRIAGESRRIQRRKVSSKGVADFKYFGNTSNESKLHFCNDYKQIEQKVLATFGPEFVFLQFDTQKYKHHNTEKY